MPSDHSGSRGTPRRGPPPTAAPVRFISDAASRIARQLYDRLTPDDILLFIKAAQPDESLVYHVGFLASDLGDRKVRDRSNMVNALQTSGVATLLQRRISAAHYLYYLIKRPVTPDFPSAVDEAVRQARSKQPRQSRTG